jgi:hypothetical protein
MHTEDVTLTAITSGLLLGLYSKDLEPILQSRPELVELLSHSVSKLQQTLAMFEKSAAIQPAAMSQPDLRTDSRSISAICGRMDRDDPMDFNYILSILWPA